MKLLKENGVKNQLEKSVVRNQCMVKRSAS